MRELELNRSNRIRLARAFSRHKRVDMSIDCVIEGQMGRALVDDPGDPTVFKIEVGPFSYFAGDAANSAGRKMIENLSPGSMIMPSPKDWIDAAKRIHGEKILEYPRYSFSSSQLSADHLRGLLDASPHKAGIKRMDSALAVQFYDDPNGLANISIFESVEDFVRRGIGFYLMDGDTIAGVAYSSLVCSRGIEVSIVVSPEHRRQGIATALACALLIPCLETGMDANWDAANPESCALAEKLGYVADGSYTEHYLRP